MSVTIARILHAGYVFGCGRTRIAFDPVFETPFSVNCHAFPAVTFDLDRVREQRFDAVFISHHHDDHCSLDSLDLLDRSTPIYIYCVHDELYAMIRRLGFRLVVPLRLGAAVEIGNFTVTTHRALDEDVDCLFQIRSGDVNVLNVVDAWIGPDVLDELVAAGPWDVILWPFQNMRELAVLSPNRAPAYTDELLRDAIDQLARLNPRMVVPSSCQFAFESWSWINRSLFPVSYADFGRAVRERLPATEVRRLDPGRAVEVFEDGIIAASPLPFVVPSGSMDVDYVYDPDQTAPSTAAVAGHFPPATAIERARVERFCRDEIPTRHAALNPSECEFFARPRRWRLRVYDAAGDAAVFHYLVEAEAMVQSSAAEPEWTTDVPLVKMYGALERGETLTSLYVRINDHRFAENVERELSRLEPADLVEDPLLRCLFNGDFAGYQRAQLARIEARRSINC